MASVTIVITNPNPTGVVTQTTIERSTNGAAKILAHTENTAMTSWIDNGVAVGNTYTYDVFFGGLGGNSMSSNLATVTIPLPPPPQPPTITATVS